MSSSFDVLLLHFRPFPLTVLEGFDILLQDKEELRNQRMKERTNENFSQKIWKQGGGKEEEELKESFLSEFAY